MGKVILLAVLTMDGCLADSSEEARKWLSGTNRYGIAEMKETAHLLNENTPLTLLPGWVKDSLSVFLMEAGSSTVSIINGMLRMRQFDEIIFYMIPVIAGNGCRLFQSRLPETAWTCHVVETYTDGTIKSVYRQKKNPCVQKKNTSLLKRVFGK